MPSDPVKKMIPTPARQPKFPDWVRWTALVFLIVWSVIYWLYWGAANFLHLCDLAFIFTCIGFWTGSVLLLSSQAVASLLIDCAWLVSAVWQYFTHRALISGTEYLFDVRYPLWVRLVSSFHVILPIVLLCALHWTGYDRRGWVLESLIASMSFIAVRFTSSALNINFAFRDPFFHRAWGPAPLHIAISLIFLNVAAFLPAHLILRSLFPDPSEGRSG
jgi:hypothetical protein